MKLLKYTPLNLLSDPSANKFYKRMFPQWQYHIQRKIREILFDKPFYFFKSNSIYS